MLKKIILFTSLILFVGCTTKYNNLPTSKNVNINKYKGT